MASSDSQARQRGAAGDGPQGSGETSPRGTIRLVNSYERSPQSQERFKTFYREWRSQWAQGDHVAPNIALYSVLAGALIGSGLMGFFFTSHRAFGLYLFSLGIFHLFEYLTTAIFNPKRVKLDCKDARQFSPTPFSLCLRSRDGVPSRHRRLHLRILVQTALLRRHLQLRVPRANPW